MAFIEAQTVSKEFAQPEHNVVALREIDLEIERGEFVVITGASGSGKSTLLSLLGALDRPTRGTIRLLGESLESAPAARLARLRRNHIGFVFQDFRLVRHLTALDNVRLPLLFSSRHAGKDTARHLVEKFGLARRSKHRPDALSRGEMQRIALARALINEPDVLLADEPTANLDRPNGEILWDHLRGLNRTEGLTVIVATHTIDLDQEDGRVVRLKDGRILSDTAGDSDDSGDSGTDQ